MSDTSIHQQLGEIRATLNIVHKNTEQIPEMVTQIALNKTAIEDMKPRVEKHDRMYRTALTLGGVGTVIWGFILAVISGGHHD